MFGSIWKPPNHELEHLLGRVLEHPKVKLWVDDLAERIAAHVANRLLEEVAVRLINEPKEV